MTHDSAATTRAVLPVRVPLDRTGLLLAPGLVIASPETALEYRVDRLLGQGGFGQVYLAKRLGRSSTVPQIVCIKVSTRIDGWLREAYFGQLLGEHPRAIRVFDAFPLIRVDGQVLYCLTLEYARHGDLGAFLSGGGKGWSETGARREIAGILEVLGKLHRGQALHRDLTPLNVFVCDDRRLKLGDFGIVRQQSDQRGVTAHTMNALTAPSDILARTVPRWQARDDVYQVGQLLGMLIKGDARMRIRPFEVRRFSCTDHLKTGSHYSTRFNSGDSWTTVDRAHHPVSRQLKLDQAICDTKVSSIPSSDRSDIARLVSCARAITMKYKALSFVLLGVVAVSHLASAASTLPSLKPERWVNSPPLAAETLRGKVVLVDFWEYTCVNWIRTAPYVKAWNRDYASLGLVVIGVHAPEFEFGRRTENIDRGIRDHGLTYPIAIDNDFAVWRALGNDAWPAKYLFDSRGRLVRQWVGEGSYDDIEREIRRQLVAARPGIQLPSVTEESSTFAKTGQPSYVGVTNETYIGAERREPGAVTLKGDWRTDRQYVELKKGNGEIVLPFTAGEVNLVMQPGPSGRGAVSVLLDGKPVGEARGMDVGTDGVARFDRSGIVRLVAGATRRRHVLTLSSSDPGLRAYVFTFGP